MRSKTKINIQEWERNGDAGEVISSIRSKMSGGLYSRAAYDFDGKIESINAKLRNTEFMTPISHTPINPLLEKAVDNAEIIHSYISNSLRDIDEIVDDPFFEVFNGSTGVLETLELIRVDNYQVENNLGITATTTHHDEMGQFEVTTTPRTIGLRDIINNDTIEGTLAMPSFTEMFQDQFNAQQDGIRAGIAYNEAEIERLRRRINAQPHLASELRLQKAQLQEVNALLVGQLDQMDNMSFDEYVQMLIHRGDVVHTVDRGWRNTASDVLDTVVLV